MVVVLRVIFFFLELGVCTAVLCSLVIPDFQNLVTADNDRHC